MLKYLSNGLLYPQQPYSSLLALVTPLPLLVAGWRSWHRRQRRRCSMVSCAYGYPAAAAVSWEQTNGYGCFHPIAFRYLATLWPPAMLLISVVAWNPPRAFLRRPGSMILVLLVTLSGITGFLGKNDLVRTIWRLDEYLPVAAARAIEAEGSSNGLLVFERNLFGNERRYELYTGAYGQRRMHLESDTASEEIIERSRGNSMVWLMTETAREDALRAHAGNLRQQGFFHCRSQRFTGDELSVVLELLLPPWPADMLRQSRLQFDDASLFAPEEPELTGDLLRLKLGLKLSGQGRLPNHSLAIHVIDSNTGARAAQDDVSVIGRSGYLPAPVQRNRRQCTTARRLRSARRALQLADRRAQSRPGS